MPTKALIIVESPAKIKTLKKFLGNNFSFASSVGHVRDLPVKEFGIDVDHDFEPTYVIMSGKKEVISKIKKAAAECDVVYLAPDPDREGEAIAWHIASILPPKIPFKRTAFHAITKEAVKEALNHPRDINLALVNAQQARRLLDRIVGYKLSPLLARKLRGRSNISAGRVQSVALMLIVEREKLIENFKSVEYWNITAILQNGDPSQPFPSRLYAIEGKRWEKESIEGKEVALVNNEKTANALLARLKKASFTVTDVEKKEKNRHPEPPFITSTLQQEASRHHRFSPSKTMGIAQSLYEGVDLHSEGAEGLITYMRTDSVRVEDEAIRAARHFIEQYFGPEVLPATPRYFKTKKSAQDAHEAIRPTNLNHPPEKIKSSLTREQYLLYDLIWKRFIASQMTSALYDTVQVDITTDQGIDLRSSGSVLKKKGFLLVYEEKRDEEEEAANPPLPPLEAGQKLTLVKVDAEQAFTKPPPRFSEALLVKELEKSGIGRPSTYAAIMQKIQSREYTVKENQRLKPTELGKIISAFLEEHFKLIMDVRFTAAMEDELELVAESKKEWKEVVKDFWGKFLPTLEAAQKEALVPKLLTDIDCPKCGSKLQKIWAKGRFFLGCSQYPECSYTTSEDELAFRKEDYDPSFHWEQSCPKCSKPMTLRHGKFGPFLGCSDYPTCKGIVNIPKKGEIIENMPSCPAVGCEGMMVKRRSRFGKTFYSCSAFPDCDVIVNRLDVLEEKYHDHPKTPYEAKKKGAPASALKLSAALAAIAGQEELTRGEALKAVWAYIKEKECQDPQNKKMIVPDKLLAELFGSKESVDMRQLPKIISQHLKPLRRKK